MILSGKEIEKRLNEDIFINPYNHKQLNPNSYNLKLHNEILIYDEDVLDMKKENKYRKLIIPPEGMLLLPGTLYLARTVEYTETNNLVPMLEGRSSIGRLGLYIHVTAGFGDVGFKGYWTLELQCVQPIRIYADTEICQIYYHSIQGEYDKYNSGKYQDNKGVQPSLLYKDFEKKCNKCTKYVENPNNENIFICLKDSSELKIDVNMAKECRCYKEKEE